MINLILFFGSFIIYGQTITLKQTKSCEICITDSICTDDTIYFNISISRFCEYPLNTYFTYYTDVSKKIHYFNTTTNCIDCNMNIAIDTVRNAWDYTLTLKSPEPSKTCPTQHVAHCGGYISRLIWFITAGLSGLFVVFGILLCCIRYCRKKNEQIKVEKKKPDVSVINA